jgi:thiol-disulfide isomerase/thioredoxin
MTARLALAAAVAVSVVATSCESAWSSEISWRTDVSAAARESAAAGKPLLLMVKARWCGPCHKMLQQSFPDPAVAARVNSAFIPLLVDADEQASLIQKLNINAFPTLLVLDSNQRVVERVTGFQTAAQLNVRLSAIRPAEVRVAQRPVRPPAPSRPAAPVTRAGTSFHDRAWASIRQEAGAPPSRTFVMNASASPRPSFDPPAPRDTLTAAIQFSQGK